MITREALLAACYKAFTQKNIKDYTDKFYQKRFDDAHGKKYFITIAEYDNKVYKERGIFYLSDFSYSPEVQFTSYGKTFDVSLHSNIESVEEMEEFFAKLWGVMRCDYYEEWSEA